ncbi:hypothetical protein KR200_000051, partial [Drosophila serrata]
SMKDYYTWTYPDIPENVAQELQKLRNSLVVVGIVGRSKGDQANKMQAFGMEPPLEHTPQDGQVQCYYKPGTSSLLLHFETTYDEAVLSKMIDASMEDTDSPFDFDSFYERMRCQFVRMVLLALHACHIVVYVETGQSFDPSLVTVFQLLKFAREQHLLQFLPSMLKGIAATRMGDKSRLCTPRILFLFENYPQDEETTRDRVSAFEFQTEDCIYELLRHHNIVTKSSTKSLMALPNNKQFVFFNAHEEQHTDKLLKAIDCLNLVMYKPDTREEEEDQEILDLAPFDGFVKPYGRFIDEKALEEQQYRKEHTVWHFLQRHVQDAQQGCFDEGSFKQQSQQGHFQLLNFKDWHECMAMLYQLLVENAKNPSTHETGNEEFKTFLNSFEDSLNFEKKFWAHLCDLGLKKGIAAYKQAAPSIYGSATHKQLLADATLAFGEEGRGPPVKAALAKLAAICQKHWQDGRQQCELLSLRSNPCTLPKDVAHEKHKSGVVHISTCNCGRTQGRREDPFTLRQANYEYYEHIAKMCNLCVKVKQYQFPIFEPSVSDYRAAAFEAAFPMLLTGKSGGPQQDDDDDDENDEAEGDEEEEDGQEDSEKPEEEKKASDCGQNLSPTFGSDLNMSIAGFGASLNESQGSSADLSNSEQESTSSGTSSGDTENELVLQLKEPAAKKEVREESTAPPPNTCSTSTTEYLPGLVHTVSNFGLLPLFPSWSLACVGPSSIYSHNTGLQEHFQSGFLSGANFLLPWDVQLRLVHAPKQQQQQQHHHHQHPGKKQQRWKKQGDRLSLKIFVGMEYECSRGHRFMMCAPDRVLRGGADIERDTCSKVVHNNMPLYYPCPCRSQINYLAQLMRIHVVTPKAPVNIIVDPKVCVGKGKYTFTLGSIVPPRLSQSAYWILRLPYVYQGDDVLIAPPEKLESDDMMAGGYLLSGMFGVAETDPSLDLNEPTRNAASPAGTFTRI